VRIGEVGKVVEEYIPKFVDPQSYIKFEGSSNPAFFTEAWVERDDGTRTDTFDLCQDIYVRIRYTVLVAQHGLQFVIRIRTAIDDVVQSYDTDDQQMLGMHPPGRFEQRLKIDHMFLKEGEYYVSLENGTPDDLYDFHDRALRFSVIAQSFDTKDKSYRRDRPGKIIFKGKWYDVATPQS
jgi:hypothetical protein